MGMLWFSKNRLYSIGLDIGDNSLKLAQLADNGKGVNIIAGKSGTCPESIKSGSAAWQKWAIEAIREAIANHEFHGRNVVSAIPPSDVFVDYVKMGPQFFNRPLNREKMPTIDEKMSQTVISKIKQKLPFEPDEAMIKHIPTEQDIVMVMATERKIIDRHLAIYEKAGLSIKSMYVWPLALTTCYTTFFGRRKTDLDAIVMLLDIEAKYSNLVICRHRNLLYACSIPIGSKQLDNEKVVTRLVFELAACRRQFVSMYAGASIERLIFLSGPTVDANIYTTIARQMEIQAQVGDCLAAVEIANPYNLGIDRRGPHVNWATSFGLSLS
jgi:Tfp pilus assembly PilM family ATPase